MTTKTTPLFQLNSIVDQVQDAQSKVIETVVLNDKLASPLKQLVEAQRTFTKEFNRSTFEAFEYFTSAAKSAVEKVTKAA